MVFAVAKTAGWLAPPARAEHVAFGSVLGPDKKMFKTRAGGTVKLADAARRGVRARARNRRREEPAAARRRRPARASPRRSASARSSTPISRAIASRTTSSTGTGCSPSTATRRRTCSTRTRARARSCARPADRTRRRPIALGAPEERALALALLGFGERSRTSRSTLQPHRLCTYLFDLATRHTSFFENCPVLKADDEAARASRLALCELSGRVLAQGLDLLGIAAPEVM